MMPDLGKYAFEVLSSYGVTLLLLCAVVFVSLRRARKVRTALDEVEQRRGKRG
ncbi:heme exporter protein CcmD [Marivita sp. GX14005]|uniref:heme exporter protein CcmD n=1 Tax=Marivita sp. GX14005 TaxID=2942276 RepID=UPI0020185F25|nr:heme exporter protein CcmD [Marivita sp. GX14005]MCL3882798.1 heme exporter protein CcmD [Marivita sp. GX14005]